MSQNCHLGEIIIQMDLYKPADSIDIIYFAISPILNVPVLKNTLQTVV